MGRIFVSKQLIAKPETAYLQSRTIIICIQNYGTTIYTPSNTGRPNHIGSYYTVVMYTVSMVNMRSINLPAVVS